MTDLRRPMEARVHQQQQQQQSQKSPRDALRSSCNSTPEPKTYPAAGGGITNGHFSYNSSQRNAMLQAMGDQSNSAGSTTSSTATTATANTVGRNYNGAELQFDEREIYYVSPTKRKGSLCGGGHTLRSNSLRACERLRSFSPTAATIAPSYPPITPSAAYGARAAGDAHDLSFDSYELASHYSDTAMQALRSGAFMGYHSSSNSSLAHNGVGGPRSNNVVTFSNYVSEQRATPPASTAVSQHRGSLRRNKGRSNQSLCSCDAGADTEINPDPARPLYEYSLERRHKRHTYTCEQNAQILMRLERERNRKLSLTGGNAAGAAKDEVQSDTPSSLDDDTIPPVPPPPALKRTNTLDVAAVIDDCTTSILKCANAVGSELMSTTTASGHKANIATLATMVSQAKPDVCRVGSHATTSFSNHTPPCIRDDIYTPHSKKSDPSLCFLHKNASNNCNNDAPELAKSPRYLEHNRSVLSLSKYNTIGPGSDYARHLSQYSQQMLGQAQGQTKRNTERCQCFSQSLSNFSRDYFGQHHQRSTGGGLDNQANSIFHTGDELDWINDGPPPPPPIISRSYSNLVDIDGSGRHQHSTSSRLPYQKFQAPANGYGGSNCSFSTAANLLNNASFTTLSSSNSGLKEKIHQHQQHYHHDHHLPSHQGRSHHQHHHHSQQLTAQQQQQQQKHHQLHASVTSIMPWKHRQCPSRGSSSSGTNSFRFDAAKHWLAVSSILLIIGAASVAVPLALRVAASAPFEERLRVAVQLLDQVPLIDGHNDLPWNIRKFLHNKLNDFKFDEDLRNEMPWAKSHWSHTDLTRLKKGRISAQFWAAYVPCEAQHRDAVQLTLEQIDVIKRLTERYSPQLTTCTSSDDIIEAHKNHQLCSLTGVEGGHSLGGSLAVLRTLYAIGVRYMTLTSTCHTPWADSSYADAPTFNVKHGGLTIFGKTIIREMNRLGMMVDLSHVSTGTMRDALEVSEAPVIFSHSSAYELCNSSRNVQDDMLQSLAKNGGLVMVNFYSKFLSCSDNSTVHDAVAHINHIKRIAGVDHVGLGAGYDGINFTPKGLEDVSSYPTLFAELLGEGWSMEDLTKLAGGNFLRVMQQVEKLRDEKKTAGVKPYEDHPNFRTDDPYNCTSS